jgi:hypothetical protein
MFRRRPVALTTAADLNVDFSDENEGREGVPLTKASVSKKRK